MKLRIVVLTCHLHEAIPLPSAWLDSHINKLYLFFLLSVFVNLFNDLLFAVLRLLQYFTD